MSNIRPRPLLKHGLLMGRDGDEYVDGQILDPDSGSTYRSKVKLLENGQKLSVRGYIGVPALGRTQAWNREE